MQRKISKEEIERNNKNQKIRSRTAKAARRSGKPVKREGKVSKSMVKTKTPRSQKKLATIRKQRR
ncbi:MAG: hypothetical protein D9C04_01530 [Nitrosopumilus sp. B06]|nr:MAG: hypothetical protein EB828_00905 [Nitrosopumilus sp. D6]RNJ80391.1 MAG: hypothetical protein D9C04_01530 [Nitrosopumilus sp. B06]